MLLLMNAKSPSSALHKGLLEVSVLMPSDPKESTGLCPCLDVDTWPFPKPAGRGRRLTMDYQWELCDNLTWRGLGSSSHSWTWVSPTAGRWNAYRFNVVCWMKKRWQCCCNFQAIGDFRIFTDISGSINESRQFMTYGELHIISWSTVQTQRFFTWPMDFDPVEILRGAFWHVTTSQTRMAIAAETPGVLTSWFPLTTNNLRLETRKHVDWVY